MTDDEQTTPKRRGDTIASALVAIVMIIGVTVLGYYRALSPEGVLTGYALSAAIAGTPVVVRRVNGH